MIYVNQLRQEISQHSPFTHEVLLKYTYQQSTVNITTHVYCNYQELPANTKLDEEN